MVRYPLRLLTRLRSLICNKRGCYAILGTDNSVTLAPGLLSMMRSVCPGEIDGGIKFFVFRVGKNFGFKINGVQCHFKDKETQLGSLQYNSKYKCLGFETLNPTVNRMFYEWGINGDEAMVKVTLEKDKLSTYFLMHNPNEKPD